VIKIIEIFKNEGCTNYSGEYKITTKAGNFKKKVFETPQTIFQQDIFHTLVNKFCISNTNLCEI
jgi:hypothetical protein